MPIDQHTFSKKESGLKSGILSALTLLNVFLGYNPALAQKKVFVQNQVKEVQPASPSGGRIWFYDTDKYYSGYFFFSGADPKRNTESRCIFTNSHVVDESGFYTLKIFPLLGKAFEHPLVLSVFDYQESTDIAAIGQVRANETQEQARQKCLEYLLKFAPTEAQLDKLFNFKERYTIKTLFPVKNRTDIENLSPQETKLQGMIYLGEYQGVRYFALPTKANGIQFVGKGPSGSGAFNEKGELIGLYTAFYNYYYGQELFSEIVHFFYKNVRTTDLQKIKAIVYSNKYSDRAINFEIVKFIQKYSLKSILKDRYERLDVIAKALKESKTEQERDQIFKSAKIEDEIYVSSLRIADLIEKLVKTDNLSKSDVDTIISQMLGEFEKIIKLDGELMEVFDEKSKVFEVYNMLSKQNLLKSLNSKDIQVVIVAPITDKTIKSLQINQLTGFNKSPLLKVLSTTTFVPSTKVKP